MLYGAAAGANNATPGSSPLSMRSEGKNVTGGSGGNKYGSLEKRPSHVQIKSAG